MQWSPNIARIGRVNPDLLWASSLHSGQRRKGRWVADKGREEVVGLDA